MTAFIWPVAMSVVLLPGSSAGYLLFPGRGQFRPLFSSTWPEMALRHRAPRPLEGYGPRPWVRRVDGRLRGRAAMDGGVISRPGRGRLSSPSRFALVR